MCRMYALLLIGMGWVGVDAAEVIWDGGMVVVQGW